MGYREPRGNGVAAGAIAYARHHRKDIVWQVVVIRVLCGRYFGGDIVSVGYAIANPRLNPVGILPPGSRPSDVHFDTILLW